MKMFFRNPEIKKQFGIYMICSLILITGAFFIGTAAGVCVMTACMGLGVMFFCFTAYRYKRIGELSENLNGILHGNENLNMLSDEEGELSVLSSEIYKATLRLKEQAELLEQDKAYLENFIADISHQMKTPMTAFRLLLLRLEDEGLDPEEKTDIMRKMKSLLERTDWLITSLLKLASIESGTIAFKRKNISLKKVMEKAAEPLQIPMEVKEIQFENAIKEDLCYSGDFGWSVEAFSNILKNCVEHTGMKGTIQISAKDNPLFLELKIADNGETIPEKELPHILERFYKGKKAGKEGYGIGLALANTIIQKQNGKLAVSNEEKGEGVYFLIRFYKGVV